MTFGPPPDADTYQVHAVRDVLGLWIGFHYHVVQGAVWLGPQRRALVEIIVGRGGIGGWRKGQALMLTVHVPKRGVPVIEKVYRATYRGFTLPITSRRRVQALADHIELTYSTMGVHFYDELTVAEQL